MFWKIIEAFWSPLLKYPQAVQSHSPSPEPDASPSPGKITDLPSAPLQYWDPPPNRPGDPWDWRILEPRRVEILDPTTSMSLGEIVFSLRSGEVPFQLTLDPSLSPPSVSCDLYLVWGPETERRRLHLCALRDLDRETGLLGASLRRIEPAPDRSSSLQVVFDILELRSAPRLGADVLLARLDRSFAGPGAYRGAHYTSYVEIVKALKREGRHDEAKALLEGLVAAVCDEVKLAGNTPPPWYFDQLRIVNVKLGRYDEAVLSTQRYRLILNEAGNIRSRLSNK